MNPLLFRVEDRPPVLTSLLLAAQHLLAALGGIIAVPLVIGGALRLPADQVVALVNAALLGSGIVTIIQCKGVGPVGIRLPCVMGTSFAFVGAAISVGMEHGVPGILGSSLVGSLVMISGSFFMPQIRKLFPHAVTGVVVAMIGLSLVPVAIDWAAGGAHSANYGDPVNLGIAFLVLVSVIGLVQWGKGIISASAIVIGMFVGYLVCLLMGKVDFTQVQHAVVFALPQPLHFGLSFPPSGIVAMSIAYMVTMVETTGTFMALGSATKTEVDGKRLSSGILCDGVGSAFASLVSSPPVSTFAQNVGVVSLTGVASRHVVAFTGVMLLLAGLFPVLGALVVTVPQPVLGGAGLMMFAMIISAGIQMLGKVEHTKRNGLIIAVAIGCGLAVTARPELLSKLPAFVKEVFGSGITVGALVAVLLNLLLPGRPVESEHEHELQARELEEIASEAA
ncbi:nucleobase:cation symporter-2 family protein [Crenobacter sp. SG2303]|uniref:Nucleobase:cation symporter-2 family protein n=1 Tax=Crenobacter oryzisoli TaxID=3056844 RepID=A0ABT7XM76_9NEIS|nr:MULTISPECIES: nucleobase:cation symporter-2 family protein [unclassified Crenobacter]MDN0074901.1 nucleobase:cation symporter-2 family protein [Crenobacter sp. SG2303]MDN0081497.1 nucleobase:cation symporter-2 family protein [Crenobacter sp. SG2305]